MAKPSDISPGGQVYDRTTGTWAGENQGTVGGGYTGDGVGRGTFVIHDANGPVGVMLNATNRVATTGADGGGSGPGAASAAAHATAGAASAAGGTGPGVTNVLSGPASVWWEEVDKKAAVPSGSKLLISDLPALQPVMKGTNTALQLGGKPFMPHPGTSNAQEIEDLMGDGDNPLEAAWWMKQYANTWHISHNMSVWANDPATQQWAKEFDQGVVRALTGQ